MVEQYSLMVIYLLIDTLIQSLETIQLIMMVEQYTLMVVIYLLMETLIQSLETIQLMMMVEQYTLMVHISFNGNSNTEFRNNTANNDGGAVYSDGGDISFNGNSNTEFRNNTANDDGGAVYSVGDVSFNGNSNTEFRDNTAINNIGAVYPDGESFFYYYGGAIMYLHANLIFNHNSTVNFTNIKETNVAVFSRIGKITELGNPTVIFNDHTVNWCANTCLPYTHHLAYIFESVITIDSHGTVRCSNEQEAFVSLSRKCGYQYLEDILVNLTSNGLATIISDKVIISSNISLTKLYNVSIIGSKNHSITCYNNTGLQVKQCNNITIEGLNWIGCGADTTPVINILNSSDVTLQKCLFQKSKGQTVVMFELSGYMKINQCQFTKNTEYIRRSRCSCSLLIKYCNKFPTYTCNKQLQF